MMISNYSCTVLMIVVLIGTLLIKSAFVKHVRLNLHCMGVNFASQHT